MWLSNSANDYDGDGCLDSSEDEDDDNDGVLDIVDVCSTGEKSWISNDSTDYDSDGCRDSSEDNDDDNDDVPDVSDACPKGVMSWALQSIMIQMVVGIWMKILMMTTMVFLTVWINVQQENSVGSRLEIQTKILIRMVAETVTRITMMIMMGYSTQRFLRKRAYV